MRSGSPTVRTYTLHTTSTTRDTTRRVDSGHARNIHTRKPRRNFKNSSVLQQELKEKLPNGVPMNTTGKWNKKAIHAQSNSSRCKKEKPAG